jgi:hypothetical protein
LRALALLAGLMLAAAAGAADVYRWVDAEGKVHFADAPPADVVAEKLAIKSAPTDPTTLATDEEELATRARQTAEEQAIKAAVEKKTAADAAAADDACAEARERYANIQFSRKFTTKDADGSERWVSGSEAVSIREQAEAAVRTACGS